MSIRIDIQDAVATVVIDRPERKNALTVEMREQLHAAFRGFASSPEVRAVVLTGVGDAFCAGVDASGMGGRDAVASRARLKALQQCVLAVHQLEKPVVAAVHGPCVGLGWSLALACDRIIASEDAYFSQIFGRMGLAPDGGSAWFLTHNIGLLRTKDLIQSCRRITAQEAQNLGLVGEICSTERLGARAAEAAADLAAGPGLALGLSKQLIHAATGATLEAFLEAELLVQTQLTQSEDYKEGVAAFKDKRAPRFQGR